MKVTEVIYTHTYKITLKAVITNVEDVYGTTFAEKLLDRIDRIVEKIIINPYLYQAIPVDVKYRRAVIFG